MTAIPDGNVPTTPPDADALAAIQARYRALQASEQRYRELFENASDMLYTTDLEGNFTAGNRALLDALSVTHDELLRMNIRDVLAPEEYARATSMTQRKIRGGDPFTKYELWITPPRGERMLVELHTRLIFEDGKPVGVQGSARDVTEARRTAEALACSEKRLREAQQIAHLGNWDWDMVNNTLTWSDEIYRIFGLDPRQWGATYEAFLERVHPDDRATVDAAVQAAVDQRRPYSVQHRIVRHDNGAVRYVHELGRVTFGDDGRPVRMIGTVQDVTDLKRTEQALRESEEHLRTIISNAPVIIYALDEDGRFTFYEGAGLEGLGFKPGERLGQRIWDLDDHPPRRVERLRRAYAGEEVSDVVEWHGRIFQARYTPSIDPASGKVTRVIAVVFDVTERHRLEEQLRQAQKMEAIGSLAGGIAHDFNNLLTVINGYTDMALATLDAGHPARRDLLEVRRAGDRAATLIQQLLAFSRKQALHPRVIDPAALIENMATLLQRLVPDNVRVTTSIEPGVGAIEVDPAQLEQVVMNLVVNARDALPDGGTIVIDLANATIEQHGEDGPHERAPGPYVRLRVSDDGLGMDEETRSRIWEPFFTTKPPGQGTGLGLPMVYGFVSQSGGAIDVRTSPGHGATFDVYLPRVADGREGQGPLPRERPGTILLVEDEEPVRAIAARALHDAGYAVIEAGSPVEALALARGAGRIDLVLTDVVMPGLDGPALVADLAAHISPLRVLYMSGQARRGNQLLTPDGRPARVLQKPFTRTAIVNAVREALDGD